MLSFWRICILREMWFCFGGIRVSLLPSLMEGYSPPLPEEKMARSSPFPHPGTLGNERLVFPSFAHRLAQAGVLLFALPQSW